MQMGRDVERSKFHDLCICIPSCWYFGSCIHELPHLLGQQTPYCPLDKARHVVMRRRMARRLYDLTIVEAVGTIHPQREGTTLRQSVNLIRLRPEKSFGRFPSIGGLYERPSLLAINNLNCSNPRFCLRQLSTRNVFVA
jgi:hypothetical protein